jgi:tetratricopeptide (TPR) repeat protein
MDKTWVVTLSTILIVLCSGTASLRANWQGTNAVMFNVEHPPLLGLTVKRVAFGNANGQCSDQLIDQVIQDFLNHQIEVIDRTHLSQILSEHRLNSSGYVDPQSAVALGKLLGPSALVYVKVERCTPQQTRLYNDEKDYKGTVTRYFLSKTQVFLNGSIQTVDLTTGKMLSAQTFESDPQRTNSATNGQPEFPPEPEVMNEAIVGAVGQVHRMFFPWSEGRRLTYHDDGDCHLKEAYMLAHGNDFQGALQQSEANATECESGRHKDKVVARAYYNLGLSYMLVGQFGKAMPMLEKALSLKGAPEAAKAMADCRETERYAAELEDFKRRAAAEPPSPPLPAVNIPQNTAPSAPPAPAAAAAQTASPPPAQTPASPATKLSITDRLKQLNDLYKQGLITKQQYDAKKAEILKQL